MAIVRVRVSGRVQGVWFRGWTVEEARSRDLQGWVRNRKDGSVEAVFAGSAIAVDEMVAACHAGPPAARVVSVERLDGTRDDLLGEGFRQLPTL